MTLATAKDARRQPRVRHADLGLTRATLPKYVIVIVMSVTGDCEKEALTFAGDRPVGDRRVAKGMHQGELERMTVEDIGLYV